MEKLKSSQRLPLQAVSKAPEMLWSCKSPFRQGLDVFSSHDIEKNRSILFLGVLAFCTEGTRG